MPSGVKMKTQNKILITIALLFVVQLLALNLVSALTIENLVVSPSEAKPGQSVTISMTLNNNENKDITNVVVIEDISGLPLKLGTNSQISIDKIKRDDQESVDLGVGILENAKTGIYNVPISVTYLDSLNKTVQRTSIATISVSSQPVISVEVEDSVVLKGQNSEISIKVVNKGLADVKFLEIQLGENSGYKLLSPSNVYIGDVDSNDFQTAQYKIFVNSNAGNTLSLPISLSYKDSLNKQYTQQENIDLRVYSIKDAQNLGLVAKSKAGIYIGIIVVVIIIYIIYRVIRNRRERKEKEEAV